MLKICKFTVEGLSQGCVTDNPHPRFSFSLESDKENVFLKSAELKVNDWSTQTADQIAIPYAGKPLTPETAYAAELSVTAEDGETDFASLVFETGKLSSPWLGQWISDPSFRFTADKISPRPLVFRKMFSLKKTVKKAKIFVTALGIYELSLNGQKVGGRYFAPGFTSYKKRLQYQSYDVTSLLNAGENVLYATVAGGWAVGSFTVSRVNRYAADRQALLLEMHLLYDDGSTEVMPSDESFDVSDEGPVCEADFYDGETYDANIDLSKIAWHKAASEKIRIKPLIEAEIGCPVIAHEILKPVKVSRGPTGDTIYDFGQNFAGVISMKIKGKAGQRIVIRHAEVLNEDGSLNLTPLRTAKATLTYICKGGEETFSPTFSYMGFRYASVSGIAEEDIALSGVVLYSSLDEIGSFECSDPRLNRLNENVIWSSKSNFMDIPTDCPQRDESMGWTGDIGIFAPTACMDFNMSRFLEKWLRDLQSEQLRTGGLPNTIPSHGYGFPATMPTIAVDFWGDACIYVPWSLYQSYGDVGILSSMYETMRKYVNACAFWAAIWGLGNYRYIWHTPPMLHFGDWVAPDCEKMSQWQGRSKYTATASLMHTSDLLSQIAAVLGKEEDASHYKELSSKAAKAYREVFTKEPGLLKNEFQTAYVLPIAFGIFSGDEKQKAVANLARLVEHNSYCIGTGFPGTPFVLFALADNGRADVAYKMLLNEKCPSWLYAVKVGATTVWEKFDGLDERGFCRPSTDGTDGMISFNHYASGSVASFFYRRIAGLEMLKPGYREFQVKPLMGGGLTHASISLRSPYGLIESAWKIADGVFSLDVKVPVGTKCRAILPSGKEETATSGLSHFEEKCQE